MTVRRGATGVGRAGVGRAGITVAVLSMVLVGCGIRSTEVPTDFGPAPSRAPCALSGPELETQAAKGIPVQVFLVCSSQLVTVDRTVRIPAGKAAADRVRVAQALLDQLERTPSAPEKQAGYTTDVRGGMTVSGPRGGDPDETLRLATPPEDLSAYALAQIVCTFANSAAAEEDGSVVLGGPNAEPLRRYKCTPAVRSRPGAQVPPSSEVGQG